MAPKEARLETTLKINLLGFETNQSQLEFIIVPSNKKVGLQNGEIILAKDLSVGDIILMDNDSHGTITKTTTKVYVPVANAINDKNQGHRRVIAKSKRLAPNILQIHLASSLDPINTTHEHRFYVDGKWVAAKDLRVGDAIASVESSPLEIIRLTDINTPTIVYNLKVEGAENFYVGDNGALAHNCTLLTKCIDCYRVNKEILSRPRNQWIKHPHMTHDLFVSHGKVNQNGVRDILTKLSNSNYKNILVLSGSDGGIYGGTAANVRFLRKSIFYLEDLEIVREMGYPASNGISVINIGAENIDKKQLEFIMRTGMYNNIKHDAIVPTYCFGQVCVNRMKRSPRGEVTGEFVR